MERLSSKRNIALRTMGLERVGALGDGWIVAGLPFDRAAKARNLVEVAARKADRDPASIPLRFQLWLSFGKNRESAVAKLERSQHWRRTIALRPGLTEEDHLHRFIAGNLRHAR
jgi:alkanesulfonate monooxygenase SsuD/methylene tetrahydromethanopterin reductase-like flavin-dependent oxidoreductase (luciferase family)